MSDYLVTKTITEKYSRVVHDESTPEGAIAQAMDKFPVVGVVEVAYRAEMLGAGKET